MARYVGGAGRLGLLAVTAVAVGPVACARSARHEPSASHPTAVTLTYLGAAGWRIDARQHLLLVDPYFSRVDAEGGGPLLPKPEIIAKYAPERADAILVGHSHYDHLLDVPAIAKNTGAAVVGTPSTLHVARAAGVAEARLVDVTASGYAWSAGPWSVRAVRGLHSLAGKPSLTIPPAVTLPMNADGYAEGGVLDYAVTVEGHTLLFIGSANFIEAELRGVRPDVAVVATQLRDKIPDYTCRLMRALDSPPLVIANHFDAHWEPLGPKQLDIGERGRADLTKFADEVRQCSPTTRVVVPKHFEPMTIPDRAPAISSQAPATPACFLLYEMGVGEIRRSPAEACASRLSPNSTFKIPHALAALDSGVLSGKDHKLVYDGTPVDFPSHGRDYTLTNAVHDSVVWYFQRVATMLGEERERAYLEKLDYGNRDPSSGLTTFWLDGSLRISPEEQARFMVRLYQDALPVDKRAMQTVREILIQPAGNVVNATGAHPFAAPWPKGTVVSAKTGRGSKTRWIVGHVARANRSWVFVSAVVVEAPEASPLAAIELAAASLRSAGVL